MKNRLFWICCLLIFCLQAYGQGGLVATLDSSQLLIGARMHIGLELEEQDDFQPLSLDMPGLDTLQAVELVGEPEWKYVDDRWQSDIQIAVFDTGFYLLPPIAVSGTKKGESFTYNSRRLPLYVYATPVDSAGVKPIKPIREEALRLTDFKWVLATISVILIVLILIWFFRKIKSSENETQVYIPPIEAHIVALDKLEKLRKKELWQHGKLKSYYVELGDILREYFENRFEFPALEMTSGELSDVIREDRFLNHFSQKSAEFFSMSDMIKFAKALPEEEIHEKWFDWVRVLILETKAEEDPEEQKSEKS